MYRATAEIAQRLGAFRQTIELLGISLWIAWVLLIYSSEFFFRALDVYSHDTLCYLLSTVSISLTFLVVGLAAPRSERWVFDCRVNIAGGLLAAAGTVGVMSLGEGDGLLLLGICSLATGVGTGLVALKGCMAMGDYSARNVFIVTAVTLFQAFLIYLAVIELPKTIGGLIVIILPLLASVQVSLYRVGESAPCYVRENPHMTSPLWRIVAALFVLAIIFSISRGMYPDGLAVSEFNNSRDFAALGSMGFCVVMGLLATALPSGASFGRLGYWMVIVVVFSVTLFPALGMTSAVSGVVSTVANSALGATTWALLGSVATLSRVSPVRIYGLGFSAFMMGSAIGWPIGYFANLQSLGFDQFYAGLALLLIAFTVALTLFRKNDLARVIYGADEEDEDAYPLGIANPPCIDRLIAAKEASCEVKEEELSESGVAMLHSPDTSSSGALPERAALGNGVLGQLSGNEASETAPSLGGSAHLPSWKARMAVLAQRHLLTERETEVFLLLAKGQNARTISDVLGFSYNTARVHVRNIYGKLDVHSRQELLEYISDEERILKHQDPKAVGASAWGASGGAR